MKTLQTKKAFEAETTMLATAIAQEIWNDCSVSGQLDSAKADRRMCEILDEVRTVAHKMQARVADASKRKACPGCFIPCANCTRIADVIARRAMKTPLLSRTNTKTTKVRKAS